MEQHTQTHSERNIMEEEEFVMRATDKINKDHEEIILPGFRFHPTDEELVGFYLRRKVEKKPLRIELIRQVDIYKYDPWDLPVPKVSCVGDKEYYLFCLRSRKYRNSVRPNRVTGSGFWKATGIDKNIYSYSNGETITECIGLKKSLVYYKGSAGKGTKTDWMMHEFRLPPSLKNSNQRNPKTITHHQEPEEWTLCRIFKRNTSCKSYKPLLKKTSIKDSLGSENNNGGYINFQDFALQQETNVPDSAMIVKHKNHHFDAIQQISPVPQSASYSNFWNLNGDKFFRDGSRWDELSPVVDSASNINPPFFFGYYT